MSKFYNIAGSTGITVELISPDEDNTNIKSILLTNVHATADATVTIFIQNVSYDKTANTYNIIHTIAIPADSSLLLDNPSMFRFPSNYGLYITVGSSDTVDVIIGN